NAAAGTSEQLDAEFVLERLDLVTERRLHDEAALSRPREALFFGDRNHIPHLLELHQSMVSVHRNNEKHVLDTLTKPAHDGCVNATTTTIRPTVRPAASRTGWTGLTAFAPIVWGTTYIVTTHLLPEGHPLFAAMMRSLPAGLIALLVARQLPHRDWWWKSLVLGLLNMGAFFPLLFIAAQHLPGGVAATLGAAQPIVVAFVVVAILNERLSTWRVWWGLTGMLGVAMVVLGPDAGLDAIGIGAG